MKKLKAENRQYVINYAKITLYQMLKGKRLLASDEKKAISSFVERLEDIMNEVYLDESGSFAELVDTWLEPKA